LGKASAGPTWTISSFLYFIFTIIRSDVGTPV
jgi:hypothetical protein